MRWQHKALLRLNELDTRSLWGYAIYSPTCPIGVEQETSICNASKAKTPRGSVVSVKQVRWLTDYSTIEFEEIPGRPNHIRCRVCTARYVGPQDIARNSRNKHESSARHQSAVTQAQEPTHSSQLALAIQGSGIAALRNADLAIPPSLQGPKSNQIIDKDLETHEDEDIFENIYTGDMGEFITEDGTPLVFSAGTVVEKLQNAEDRRRFTHQLESMELFHDTIFSREAETVEDLERYYAQRETDESVPAILRIVEESAC